MLYESIISVIYFGLFRPVWKWILHKWTGRCELLRIAYNIPSGSHRSIDTESSLKHSKSQALKRLLVDDHVDINDAVHHIMKIKSVSPDLHPEFAPSLRVCLGQICGYRRLICEVEVVRKVPYCSENPDHERLLQLLWNSLRPSNKLTSRISKQWAEIGFQGDDPMTDFRGMGILGLENLIYFVTHFPAAARQLVSRSNHPQLGYPFAITGINITGMAVQLLTQGHLKTHMYNVVQGPPTLTHFHRVYCYLLYEFDRFWFAEKPRDIMEFNRIKNKYQTHIAHKLKQKDTILRCDFNVKQDVDVTKATWC